MLCCKIYSQYWYWYWGIGVLGLYWYWYWPFPYLGIGIGIGIELRPIWSIGIGIGIDLGPVGGIGIGIGFAKLVLSVSAGNPFHYRGHIFAYSAVTPYTSFSPTYTQIRKSSCIPWSPLQAAFQLSGESYLKWKNHFLWHFFIFTVCMQLTTVIKRFTHCHIVLRNGTAHLTFRTQR